MGYREQLNECTDPVSGDWLEITNVGNATDKDQKLNVARLAIVANANTFAATQTIAPAAGSIALALTTPTNQNAAMLSIGAADCGSGAGPYALVNRNSNASTPSAGFLYLTARTGTGVAVWIDNTGTMRLNTSALPTNANDTSGTVVGAQTSYIGVKDNVTEWNDRRQALDAVLACKLFHYHLKGDASKRQYAGLIITDSDKGAWFSENDADNQTPTLNERNLFGYLIAAIQEQQKQIDTLSAQVAALLERT